MAPQTSGIYRQAHWRLITVHLNDYQQESRTTARYPDLGSNLIYPTLGLAGEAGEVADKVKKLIRDRDGLVDQNFKQDLALELGDVLWYIAQLCTELGMTLEDVAEKNIEKLNSRSRRGTLHGDGDHR